jgi:hypothetical protein
MKKYSTKFWIVFVAVSVILLVSLFVVLEVKNKGLFGFLREPASLLPLPEEMSEDLQTLLSLAESLSNTNGQEKAFLILLQNNMELRPGGGYIGSFAIVKIKDGQPSGVEVHDTVNFDGRIPDTVPAPYPMQETLGVKSLKLRDSNYHPDFALNAKEAEDFYHLGNGQEQFAGVIGVTTRVLESVLEVTGPVEVPGYPGSYGKDNAVLDLEYQVEKAYADQGLERGERKVVIHLLAQEILKKAKALPLDQKYRLFKVILSDLHQKDVQIQLKDPKLQAEVAQAGWDGELDTAWKNDYLFLVDSNMNAFKSDLYMERSYDYAVDLTQTEAEATLKVTYTHTAKEKSYLTKDYQSYSRVYVPKGSFIDTIAPLSHEVVYGEELEKKVAGTIVQVPLGTEKTLVYSYKLPKTIDTGVLYDLKIQKQPGMKTIPMRVSVKNKNGSVQNYQFNLERDVVLSTLTPQ